MSSLIYGDSSATFVSLRGSGLLANFNKKHFYNGKYWTYNSVSAFSELFPFWTQKQVRRILDSLKNNGLIETGNYNKNSYDRTIWYTVTEKALSLMGISICPNGQMDFPKKENQTAPKGEPIPKINTKINTKCMYSDTEGAFEISSVTPPPPTHAFKKVKDCKKYIPPTIEECKEYAISKNMIIDVDYFYEFYEAGEWHNKKGEPIKNWKQEMLSWNRQEAKNTTRRKEEPKRKYNYAN